VVDVITQPHRRWPDPKDGPFELCVTVAIVDGRPEAVGLEVWACDPAQLPKQFTGMTAKAATEKWRFVDREAEPDAIRTADIRRIALGQIVDEAVQGVRKTATVLTTSDQVGKRKPAGWAARPAVQKEAKRILEVTEPPAPKPKGRRPLPRSHYEEVARVYLGALADRREPTRAVKDYWAVSKSQAAKWIYRCRRPPLNLLDPTDRGRPAGGPELVRQEDS
jgi:hypothetical protein